MRPSVVVTRCGSAKDAGLFLLEGGLDSFQITPDVIRGVAETREGFKANAEGYVFKEDGVKRAEWLNNLPGFHNNGHNFIADYILCTEPGGPLDTFDDIDPESLFLQIDMEKIAEKKYISKYFGLVPSCRMLKAILRQDAVGTKRVVLFGTGIPANFGGQTWLISPYGFPWMKDPGSHIVGSGITPDLREVTERDKYLFAAITDSVPMFSGHLGRKSDEPYPRLLSLKGAAMNTEAGKLWHEFIVDLPEPFIGDKDFLKAMQLVSKLRDFGVPGEGVIPSAREVGFSLDDAMDLGALDELF
jgi:hypothetical protein